METPKLAKVIAFDFDGVIARYGGWVDKDHHHEPNPEVFKAIKLLKEKGFKILVHSTRGDELIRNYCEKYSIPVDYINRRPDKEGENPGKPIAYVYVDDRAICYKGEKADDLVKEIENFKAYWEE
jgi:phosphoserine phosphatase